MAEQRPRREWVPRADAVVNAQPPLTHSAPVARAVIADATLEGESFWRFDHRNACLDRANLSGSNLDHASLHEASLRDARLARASLWQADVRKADLNNADRRWAKLALADLRGATLNGANFTNATLWGARLNGADLRGAIGLVSEQLKNAELDAQTQQSAGAS
jgi:uncharacterized protein YjbI with pentapeptide repeats